MICKKCESEFEPHHHRQKYCDGCRGVKEVSSVKELMTELNEPLGPLDVYSPARWSRLQKVGYVMPNGDDYDGQRTQGATGEIPLPGKLGYARKVIRRHEDFTEYSFGIPAPGDPGYEEKI